MIKNTLAEIIFKMFYTKVSQMMTEIDIFKNISTFVDDTLLVALIVEEKVTSYLKALGHWGIELWYIIEVTYVLSFENTKD